jgi:DNA-binding NarL/FixJ family response regulator
MYLNLSESNHIKEHYIANFLNIHSEYIDKIDKYQKVVKKMLASRKYEELYQRANSQEVVNAEIAEFYKTFDQAFLHIYPDFISQLNSLLLDSEKIKMKDDELLNTELRIFALIRLGIKDSSQISRLLRYSVNTIYNYRVRIKNKSAVPREDFEEHVQSINAFQKD